MITFDPYKTMNPARADSTTINIGTRSQIELFQWKDEEGKTHALVDPSPTAIIPKGAMRTAFSVGWLMDQMLTATEAQP